MPDALTSSTTLAFCSGNTFAITFVIPHSSAITLAVSSLSPVSIIVSTSNFLNISIASMVDGFTSSFKAIIPRTSRLVKTKITVFPLFDNS